MDCSTYLIAVGILIPVLGGREPEVIARTIKFGAVRPVCPVETVTVCDPADGDGILGTSVEANQFWVVVGLPMYTPLKLSNPIQSTI